MTSTYVLFLFVTTAAVKSHTTITTVDFGSREACIAAAKETRLALCPRMAVDYRCLPKEGV